MAPKRICLIGAGPSGMSVLYQLERLRKEGVDVPEVNRQCSKNLLLLIQIRLLLVHFFPFLRNSGNNSNNCQISTTHAITACVLTVGLFVIVVAFFAYRQCKTHKKLKKNREEKIELIFIKQEFKK